MCILHYSAKVYADIRGDSLGGASNDSGVVDNGNFSVLLAISLETLEMRPALLYSDTQSVVSFSVIPKCTTLNDLQWLFPVKFGFRAGFSGFRSCDFRK